MDRYASGDAAAALFFSGFDNRYLRPLRRPHAELGHAERAWLCGGCNAERLWGGKSVGCIVRHPADATCCSQKLRKSIVVPKYQNECFLGEPVAKRSNAAGVEEERGTLTLSDVEVFAVLPVPRPVLAADPASA